MERCGGPLWRSEEVIWTSPFIGSAPLQSIARQACDEGTPATVLPATLSAGGQN